MASGALRTMVDAVKVEDATEELRAVVPDIIEDLENLLIILATSGGSGKLRVEIDFSQMKLQGYRPGLECARRLRARGGGGGGLTPTP